MVKSPSPKRRDRKITARDLHRMARRYEMALPGAIASYWISRRVEIPVWTDTWMRGDRYGTVVKLTPSKKGVREHIAHVLLDKSGRTKKFRTNDLKVA